MTTIIQAENEDRSSYPHSMRYSLYDLDTEEALSDLVFVGDGRRMVIEPDQYEDKGLTYKAVALYNAQVDLPGLKVLLVNQLMINADYYERLDEADLQWKICHHSQSRRLVLVWDDKTSQGIADRLMEKFKVSSSSHPSIDYLTDKDMETILSYSTLTDVVGDTSSVTSQKSGDSSDTIAQLDEAIEEDEVEKLTSYIEIERHGSHTCFEKNWSGGVYFDSDLTTWLKKNSDETRWSVKYNEWNNMESRVKHNMDGVQNWNSSRPTDMTCAVIPGILNAVLDMHSRGLFHGNLDNLSNYLLLFGTRKEGVYSVPIVKVFIRGTETDSCHEKSMGTDLMCIEGIIFDNILKRNRDELPMEWQLLFDYMRIEKEFQRRYELIKDFPAFWHWNKRFNAYQQIWLQYSHGKYMQLGGSRTLACAIKDVANRVPCASGWTTRIPQNTPFYSILNNNFYSHTGIGLLCHIRIVHSHFLEYDEKYNKYEYLEGWLDSDYVHEQYIELCTSMIHPLFLVKLYDNVSTSAVLNSELLRSGRA